MTYSDFKNYDSEVKALVNKVLNAVKEKSFSDYVLLLARGGYQVENEDTSLSPYVIASKLELLQDKTRETFLVSYLNAYVNVLSNNVMMKNEDKEFNLNIQMMIYSQIWESHQLLKILKRIGGILAGNPYEWKISFEYINEKGKIKSFPKGKMIEDQILPNLSQSCPDFAKFVGNVYDSQLRNSFAHASYYINIEKSVIRLLNSEGYLEKRKIALSDWEKMFIYSVLLSYHLPHALIDRCNNFPKDYPEIKHVEIDWPSYKTSGKVIKAQIFPEISPWGVEFNFRQGKK